MLFHTNVAHFPVFLIAILGWRGTVSNLPGRILTRASTLVSAGLGGNNEAEDKVNYRKQTFPHSIYIMEDMVMFGYVVGKEPCSSDPSKTFNVSGYFIALGPLRSHKKKFK